MISIQALKEDPKIAVIGLGYVGLPLAIEFGKKYQVLGFDINQRRVEELRNGIDYTNEVNTQSLCNSVGKSNLGIGVKFSFLKDDLIDCNIYIVTVPTPIDKFKCPNLIPLLNASSMIGGVLKKGDVVIYESTVYPGCTEEECVPVLEKASGFEFNKGFYCGYSPERINPGDKINKLITIKKVTSGSTREIADFVDWLYNSIIIAGTYRAPSIMVAEACKAIENAQRDINISFVNELALIFDRMGIDTNDVIDAASTKWNFVRYKPGLVGGHCIGVDPFYLAHKAQLLGYHPEVILSGRRVNDNMGMFVANKVIKLMINKGQKIQGSNALILGITFKENCPDIRNTRVTDIYAELKTYGVNVDLFDPNANKEEVARELGLSLLDELNGRYDAIILAVSHQCFKLLKFGELKNGESAVIFDTKAFLDRTIVDGRL